MDSSLRGHIYQIDFGHELLIKIGTSCLQLKRSHLIN
jgi:hypothetical protein